MSSINIKIKNKGLFFALIFALGVILSYLAQVQLDELFPNLRHQTQSVYEGVLMNIAAGFFLASILYLLRRRFWVDEDLQELNKISTNSDKINDKVLSLEEGIKDIYTVLRGLDIAGQTVKIIYREEDYYKQVNELIKNTEVEVVYIGDGFTCHDNSSKRQASELVNAFKEVVKKGKQVKYYQWKEAVTIYMLNELERLKRRHNSVKIYLEGEHHLPHHPVSTILIDPSKDSGYVCLKFTRDYSNAEEELNAFNFGAGFIVKDGKFGQEKLDFYRSHFSSKEFGVGDLTKKEEEIQTKVESSFKQSIEWDKINLNIDKENLIRIANSCNVLELDIIGRIILEKMRKEKEVLYFDYALDLEIGSLEGRYSPYYRICNIKVKQYKVCLTKAEVGDYSGFGVLNIEPGTKSDGVWGALYAVSTLDFTKLEEEKRHNNFKVKQQVEIGEFDIPEYRKIFGHAEKIHAFAFFSTAPQSGKHILKEEYSKQIQVAMNNNQLPEEYQKEVGQLLKVK